jgi:hypothetical protein
VVVSVLSFGFSVSRISLLFSCCLSGCACSKAPTKQGTEPPAFHIPAVLLTVGYFFFLFFFFFLCVCVCVSPFCFPVCSLPPEHPLPIPVLYLEPVSIAQTFFLCYSFLLFYFCCFLPVVFSERTSCRRNSATRALVPLASSPQFAVRVAKRKACIRLSLNFSTCFRFSWVLELIFNWTAVCSFSFSFAL